MVFPSLNLSAVVFASGLVVGGYVSHIYYGAKLQKQENQNAIARVEAAQLQAKLEQTAKYLDESTKSRLEAVRRKSAITKFLDSIPATSAGVCPVKSDTTLPKVSTSADATSTATVFRSISGRDASDIFALALRADELAVYAQTCYEWVQQSSAP